jgi:hypothetical protein
MSLELADCFNKIKQLHFTHKTTVLLESYASHLQAHVVTSLLQHVLYVIDSSNIDKVPFPFFFCSRTNQLCTPKTKNEFD